MVITNKEKYINKPISPSLKEENTSPYPSAPSYNPLYSPHPNTYTVLSDILAILSDSFDQYHILPPILERCLGDTTFDWKQKNLEGSSIIKQLVKTDCSVSLLKKVLDKIDNKSDLYEALINTDNSTAIKLLASKILNSNEISPYEHYAYEQLKHDKLDSSIYKDMLALTPEKYLDYVLNLKSNSHLKAKDIYQLQKDILKICSKDNAINKTILDKLVKNGDSKLLEKFLEIQKDIGKTSLEDSVKNTDNYHLVKPLISKIFKEHHSEITPLEEKALTAYYNFTKAKDQNNINMMVHSTRKMTDNLSKFYMSSKKHNEAQLINPFINKMKEELKSSIAGDDIPLSKKSSKNLIKILDVNNDSVVINKLISKNQHSEKHLIKKLSSDSESYEDALNKFIYIKETDKIDSSNNDANYYSYCQNIFENTWDSIQTIGENVAWYSKFLSF
ncbi:hypothetical protein [Rickettsia endosymbiont of Orchestes rusci]|uniref:hypothetical protein n=1 Tax=Rickettsia endosymbiont of Orchestes rusci TaxID=3066250 RepID=UPI00313DF734